jgi:hypothetical protein
MRYRSKYLYTLLSPQPATCIHQVHWPAATHQVYLRREPGRVVSVTCTSGTSVYRIQHIKGKTCAHVLSCAMVTSNFISLFREGSGTIIYPEAMDPTSSSRRGLVLQRVLWHRILPHHPGGVWCCHVSLGIRPRLTVKDSDADTRPSALDCVSPQRGGLRCLHVSHGSSRAVGHRDKERLSCNDM